MTISKSIKMTALCLLMLLVVVFGFAACGGLTRLTDGPNANDVVTGNGGLAVQKGDYLYFTNGYINTADVGTTNEYGNVDVSAIYRVKLTDGKVIEKNVEYKDDGSKKVDKTQALNDIEIIVPKVAGFEYSDLYIFGDYIYFATPNHLKDREQNVLSTHLNYYRARLDRSGNIEQLYSTLAENTAVTMTMYQVGDTVYQVILDDSTLVVVSIGADNRIVTTTVSEEANDASMPKYSNSNDTVYAIDNKIYYTENMQDNKTGTILKAYDLATKESTVIYNNEGETYEIIGTRGNYLYFTLTTAANPGHTARIYAASNDNFSNKIEISAIPVSDNDITAYSLVSPENALSIIYTDGTNTYFKRFNEGAIVIANSNILANIVEVQGDTIYYIANSTLNSLVYTSAGNTANTMVPSSDTPKADIAKNFDVDGSKVFYFVQYANNYYMHYADYSIVDLDTNETPYSHFIGSLIEDDYLNVDEDGNLVEESA